MPAVRSDLSPSRLTCSPYRRTTRPLFHPHPCCAFATEPSIVVTHENPVVSAFRSRHASPETRTLLRERGRVVELVNAWLKEELDLRRFHVRGLAKVGSEALWAVLTYNIQQWIRLRWRPRFEEIRT